MSTPEVLLACARPAEIPSSDWTALERLLAAEQRDKARRFRFEADRRSFVLTHALMRALAATEIGIAAERIRLLHDVKGRPFIAQAPQLHISLSGTRDAVACAVTRATPVGVDVEKIEGKPVDASVLGIFVATQETTHNPMDAREFFFRWTALEAFWKACGTGLVDGQPRICCVPRTGSRFDIHLERGAGGCAGRGAIVNAFPDCALAVVLRAPVEPGFVLKRTHCRSAGDILGLARAHERFCAA